jgi:cytosine/uracil/thiamine/allantoin permease
MAQEIREDSDLLVFGEDLPKSYATFEHPESHFEATSQEDLKPIPQHLRTWGWLPYAAMWCVLSMCIPSFAMGTSLLILGLNWWQATLACAVGNLVTVFPLTLNGYVGTKYGIAYPVVSDSF